MSSAIIEAFFPTLPKHGYQITSAETSEYNCFAWGLSNKQRWWSPVPNCGYHWPADVEQNLTIETFVELYAKEGRFETCDSDAHELGVEKLAIYCKAGEVTHVARQVETGKWSSKLGDWEDIEHNTLDALEGAFYGTVAKILKRVIT